MRQKGITLIEILAGVSILAVIGLLLGQILIQNNSVFLNQTAQINQGLDLNDDLQNISIDIKNASMIAPGYPSASPTVISGPHIAVLALPSVDSSNQMIDQKFDYEIISADAAHTNILKTQLFPDPQSSRTAYNKVLTTQLSSINFSYLDGSGSQVSPSSASRVSVSIDLSTGAGTSSQQNSASATINLRNN